MDDTKKESPVKLGLIGIAIGTIIGSWAWNHVKGGGAPTATADGANDWLAMAMQVFSMVLAIVAAFGKFKKALPQNAIQTIMAMVKEGHVDIGALIAMYGQIDKQAILDLIKQLKGGIMPPISIKDDVIKIDPKPTPVDPNVPAVVVPVDPAVPVHPIVPAVVTSNSIARQIQTLCSQFKDTFKLDLTVGATPLLSLEAKVLPPND